MELPQTTQIYVKNSDEIVKRVDLLRMKKRALEAENSQIFVNTPLKEYNQSQLDLINAELSEIEDKLFVPNPSFANSL